MRLLSIAALQISPHVADPQATLEDFERRVFALCETFNELQLVVVPELHLAAVGGFFDERPDGASEAAVEIPGPLTDRLGSLARATGLWLVPGSIYERGEGEDVHNTALAISPTGEIVAAYRKCFPWQPYEQSVPGRTLVVFDVPDVGRVGLAICHDGAFPEVFRQLAWMGAEVVLQPTLTTTIDRDAELVLARANAIANQLYVVNVNAPGPTALGRSAVIDPEGIVRVQAGSGEELITDVLDLDAVTRVRTVGSFGLNRLLEQFDRLAPTLELPMYGGLYAARTIGQEGAKMSTATSAAHAAERRPESPEAIAPKGLRSGIIGLLGSTVLGKSLGPRLGWIASWALLAATFIALANLANITGKYFFLLIDANGAANAQWATILVGCSWLAVCVYLGVRGLEISSRTQILLLTLGLAVLVLFAGVAVVKLIAGTAGSQSLSVSLDWLNPGAISGSGALSSGLLLAIFFYWGWDGPAAVVEESRAEPTPHASHLRFRRPRYSVAT